MKKLLKPEMEFIKFNTEDVITTSGGDTPAVNDTVDLGTKQLRQTVNNAHDSTDYSSGGNSLWNKLFK